MTPGHLSFLSTLPCCHFKFHGEKICRKKGEWKKEMKMKMMEINAQSRSQLALIMDLIFFMPAVPPISRS